MAFVVAVVLITLPLVVIAALPDKKPQIQKQNVEQIHKIVVPEKVTLGEIPKGERPAPEQPKVQVRTQARLTVSGEQCVAWMRQAGVPEAQIQAGFKLIMRESGCQVGRLNNDSYACGIAQALPCTKIYPHATKIWISQNKFIVNRKWFIPGDPIKELSWMKRYVEGRYGTWHNALAHSYQYGWY